MVIYTFSATVILICNLWGFYMVYIGSSVPKYSSVFKSQAVDCLTLADGNDKYAQKLKYGTAILHCRISQSSAHLIRIAVEVWSLPNMTVLSQWQINTRKQTKYIDTPYVVPLGIRCTSPHSCRKLIKSWIEI